MRPARVGGVASTDRPSAAAGACPTPRARGRRPAAPPARCRIARRTSRASTATPAAVGIEPTSATRVTRSGAAAASASACGPPADQPIDCEPLGLELRRAAPRPRRAAIVRRTAGAAAVDGEQPHAERRRDRVVGMAREPRVAAAVQIDDRRAGRVADVVERYADDQRPAHAARSMVCDRAPERVSPRRELHGQLGTAARAARPAFPRCAARRSAARAGRARPGRSSRARSPPCPASDCVRESEYENSRATTCIRAGAGARASNTVLLAKKSAATSSASLI